MWHDGDGVISTGLSDHLKHAVHSASDGASRPEIKLPRALDNLVIGLRAGHGITSPRSPLTKDGVRPDLVPIVVTFSHETGLKSFLTCLATLSALKEVRSGDVILTFSFNLLRADLTSLLETSRKGGPSDEIPFEISMQAPGPDGTWQNT